MKKIFLIGWFGRKNLGDDILFHNVIGILDRSGFSEVYFFVDSKENLPEVNTSNLVLKPINFKGSFKGHIFLKTLFFIIRTNYLVFGGGSMFSDNDSDRLTSLKQKSFQCKLASLLNKKILTVACGFGPINSNKGEELLTSILKNMDIIQARDSQSINVVKKCNKFNTPTSLCFDPAIDYVSKLKNDLEININKESLNIGLSLSQTPGTKENKRDKILIKLRTSLNKLAVKSQNSDINLYLIQMCAKPGHDDIILLNEFVNDLNLNKKIKLHTIAYTTSTPLFIKQLANLDAIISERLHTCIIAFSLKIPFLSIAYHKKCLDFISAVNYVHHFDNIDLNYFFDELSNDNGSVFYKGTSKLPFISSVNNKSNQEIVDVLL
ncbi:polysaccharide pyruvyl transferase family protein [Colwellia piezophila]|uniref:polysaccharide pyruvyl transferase family protein n=1 Tax=Colwellia piezophila TaxID=211668 RepID=UPI000372FAD3|nr:polysaccharide pyruvyl transferase family protein [Colwellia piezophila]